MKITKEEVLKLAQLSRLKLSDAEVEKYQHELSEILDYVAKLDAVEVDGLKPTYQVTGLTSNDENASREDIVEAQVSQSELLKNVPTTKDGHIQVKRMIG